MESARLLGRVARGVGAKPCDPESAFAHRAARICRAARPPDLDRARRTSDWFPADGVASGRRIVFADGPRGDSGGTGDLAIKQSIDRAWTRGSPFSGGRLVAFA